MIDLKLELQSDGLYDIPIGEDGNFETDDGLTTTILTSIFTDARADESEVSVTLDRRGWLGNLNFPTEGRQLGSLIWLSSNMRRTTGNLNKVIDYYKKCLNWLLEDEIAKDIQVTGALSPEGATINITVIPYTGEPVSVYTELWRTTVNG